MSSSEEGESCGGWTRPSSDDALEGSFSLVPPSGHKVTDVGAYVCEVSARLIRAAAAAAPPLCTAYRQEVPLAIANSGPRLCLTAAHRYVGVVVAAFAVLVVASGCTPTGTAAAQRAVTAFQGALARSDAKRACALLSDEARTSLESTAAGSCAQKLPVLRLPTGPVRSLQVWGDNSQARLDNGAVFLAKFRDGWKVTAAGCSPRTGKPYDCTVKG